MQQASLRLGPLLGGRLEVTQLSVSCKSRPTMCYRPHRQSPLGARCTAYLPARCFWLQAESLGRRLYLRLQRRRRSTPPRVKHEVASRGLYPKQRVTDLEERRAIFVALKLDGVERLLQKRRQISRAMKIRSYDAESLVHVAHRTTHDFFPPHSSWCLPWNVTFQRNPQHFITAR